MIPRDYITAWRTRAPWAQDAQVEQDLVLSRALVEIFSHPLLSEGLAMRGGTAIYKLYRHHVTRALFEQDLVAKLSDPRFAADIGPLLSHGYRWDIGQGAKAVLERLGALLPGEPSATGSSG
ncbi:MAG: hypothetical protein F4208_07005 [Gemmatimonadales bacterium]|nr:hypothetical protein [Gemmatimonadales bacterium]